MNKADERLYQNFPEREHNKDSVGWLVNSHDLLWSEGRI